MKRSDSLAIGGGIGVRDELRTAKRARAPFYCPLSPGDIVVAFSDGVIEARSEGRMFSRSRVTETVVRCARNPERIAMALWQAVQDFCHPAKVDDDVTIVVARIPDPDEDADHVDD